MLKCPTNHLIDTARAAELERIVNERVDFYVERVRMIWPNINYQRPTVRYDLRGTTAGYAYYATNIVKFNPILLHENTDDFKTDTIPHEIAHVVSFKLYGLAGKGHGPNWKHVMRRLGVTPTRCHSLDVTNSKVRHVSKTAIYCTSCGNHISDVTAKIVNSLHRRHSLCCKATCTTIKPLSRNTVTQFIAFAIEQKQKGVSSQRIMIDGMLKFGFEQMKDVRMIMAVNSHIINRTTII